MQHVSTKFSGVAYVVCLLIHRPNRRPSRSFSPPPAMLLLLLQVPAWWVETGLQLGLTRYGGGREWWCF